MLEPTDADAGHSSARQRAWFWSLLLLGQLAAQALAGRSELNPFFLTALPIYLAATVVAWRAPGSGLLLWVLLVPLADWLKRVSLLAGPPDMLAWYGGVLLPDLVLATVVLRLLQRERRRLWPTLRHSAVPLLGVLLAAWWTLSLVWHADGLRVGLAGLKLTAIYLPCILIAPLARPGSRFWDSLMWRVALAGALTGLYGVWQLLVGWSSFEQLWHASDIHSLQGGALTYGGVRRSFSTYSDHATFGLSVGIGILAALSLWGVTSRWRRLALALAMLACFAGMVSTLSRTSTVGLILALGGLGCLHMLRQRRWLAAALRPALALLCAVGLMWGMKQLKGVLENPYVTRAATLGTVRGRTVVWKELLNTGRLPSPNPEQSAGGDSALGEHPGQPGGEQSSEQTASGAEASSRTAGHPGGPDSAATDGLLARVTATAGGLRLPLLGNGIGSLSSAAKFAGGPRSADNTLLKVYLESGLVGLGLFLGLFLALAWHWWRTAFERATSWSAHESFALGVTVYMLLASVLAPVIDYRPPNAYLWLACGILALRGSGPEQPDRGRDET